MTDEITNPIRASDHAELLKDYHRFLASTGNSTVAAVLALACSVDDLRRNLEDGLAAIGMSIEEASGPGAD